MASAPAAGAVCPFDALPVAVLRRIFLALPADSKGRASAVCRAWRDVLADATLWEVLDLSSIDGVTRRLVRAALVRGAAARAGGQLKVLDVRACYIITQDVVALAAANGAALRELHVDSEALQAQQVDAILAAAPQLQLLCASIWCVGSVAGALLRKEPPYGPLRAQDFHINCRGTPDAALLSVAAAVAGHSQLKALTFEEVNSNDPAILDALFDAARLGRTPDFSVLSNHVFPGNHRALARLLQCDTLTSLSLRIDWNDEVDEDEFALLAPTLQGAIHLESLSLEVCLWDFANFGEILAVLQALPALRRLNLGGNSALAADQAVVGRALGALLAADWPRLHTLNVEYCNLEDDAMAYVFAGLSANTHLRELLYFEGNDFSEDFHRDILTPALNALDARSAAQ